MILELSKGGDRDGGGKKLWDHAIHRLTQGSSAGRSTRGQAGPAIVPALLRPSPARDARSAGHPIRPGRFPAERRKRCQLNLASLRDTHPEQLRSASRPVLQYRRQRSIEADRKLPDTLPNRGTHSLRTGSTAHRPAFGVQEDITDRPMVAPNVRCIRDQAHTGCMPAAVSSRVRHQNAAGCRQSRRIDHETPYESALLLQPDTPVPTDSA